MAVRTYCRWENMEGTGAWEDRNGRQQPIGSVPPVNTRPGSPLEALTRHFPRFGKRPIL